MFSIDNLSYKDYCPQRPLIKNEAIFNDESTYVDNRNKIAKKCLGPHNVDVNNKRSQPKVSQHPADSNSDLGTIRTINSKQFGEYEIYAFQRMEFDL